MKSSSASSLQGPCYIKLLVISGVAGSIIGKNGSEIANLLKAAECTIKLSTPTSFFPNTPYRVCSISGTLENIQTAAATVLSKIKDYAVAYGLDSICPSDASSINLPKWDASEDRIVCTIAVPKTAVSSIIGRGGECIKTLAESTGCKIVVSERENGLNERLVNFYGAFECVKNALFNIMQTIQDDSNLRECCMKLDYSQFVEMPPHPAAFGPAAALPPPPNPYAVNGYGLADNVAYPGVQPFVLHSACEIIVHIPDSAMGAVIGKQGSCMSEIMRKSGAKVTVSQKGELVPGTADRPVTISGNLVSVHHAHAMLWQQYILTSGSYDPSAPAANGSMIAQPRRDYGTLGTAVYNTGKGPAMMYQDTFPSGHALRHARSRPPLVSPYAVQQ